MIEKIVQVVCLPVSLPIWIGMVAIQRRMPVVDLDALTLWSPDA